MSFESFLGSHSIMPNRNIAVGIFVIAGFALFSLGIVLIGNQNSTFKRYIEIYTEFANIDGVAKGTKMRVAGMNAGEVADLAVPDKPSSKFRLKLKIDQRLHALVRTDSVVTIATEGVVGDKYLLVHPGSAPAAPAVSLTTLPSREPIDLGDLMEHGTDMLKDANSRMKEVSGKLNGAFYVITTTVNNANDIVVGLKQGRGAAGVHKNRWDGICIVILKYFLTLSSSDILPSSTSIITAVATNCLRETPS
jgi:phospholipid/cholesterol/gamma-HCH transport system substrate-binding protein